MNLFQDNIKKLYFSYLIPTLLGAVSNSIYVLVDVYFISKGAGSIGLASLNIAMPVFTIYSCIGLLFGVGGATVMGVAEGSNQKDVRDKAFTMSVVFMAGIGLFISIFGSIFVEAFATALGANQELLPHVMTYLLPINISAVAFVLMYSSSILMRADHAPKVAMYALMCGNFSNIILDYVFVMLFNWGIFGASFATALSPVITLTVISFHFIRKKNTVHLNFHFRHQMIFKRIFSSGMGSALIDLSAGFVILVFNAIILEIGGASALAAYAIITNIAYVVKGQLNGFSQAAQPIISANFGAGMISRSKEMFHFSLLTSMLFVSIAYALFFVFPEPIAAFFAEGDPIVIKIAANGIRIYFTSMFFMAANAMYMNYFQSIEQGKISSFIAICKGVLFVGGAVVILGKIFGLNGIWWSVCAAEFLSLFLCIYFMRKQKKY